MPGAPEADPTVVPAPLEAVFWAIIDVVGEYQIPLETMDIGRGYLRSEPTAFSGANAQEFWACSPEPDQVPEGVLSIRALPVNDGETRLQVTAVPAPGDGRWCSSTGVLEAQLSERVYARWQELTAE